MTSPLPGKAKFCEGWACEHIYESDCEPSCHAPSPLPTDEDAREVEGDCIPWDGCLNAAGYGSVRVDGKRWRAHRLVYTQVFGEIPSGFVIDHICHNEALARGECAGGRECTHKRCVNPKHLEAKSQRDNIAAGGLGYQNRTVCRAGKHDITAPDAFYVSARSWANSIAPEERLKGEWYALRLADALEVTERDRAYWSIRYEQHSENLLRAVSAPPTIGGEA